MKISMQQSGSVVIDGKEYCGKNISISNGKINIDGALQKQDLVGDIDITVYGDIDRLEHGSGKVIANNIGSVSTASGDVKCADVSGSVQTMSGDVNCGSVGGNVNTMSGDINSK